MYSFSWINWTLLSVGISVAISVTLGFVVLLSDTKSMTHRSFFYFSLVNGLWGVANYFQYQLGDPIFVLWMLRLVMFSAVWQAFSFFELAYVYPRESIALSRWFSYGIAPLVAVVSGLTLTPLVFSAIHTPIIMGKIAEAIPGPGIPVFGLTAVGLVIAGIFLLVRRLWHATDPALRIQLWLFSIGTALMFTLIIIGNFIFPVVFGNLAFIPLGSVFTLPFVVLISIAILKYRFLNIKIIATGTLTFAIWLILFLRILEENTLQAQILDSGVLLFVIIFGFFLVKSVQNEVYQKEQLQLLSQAKSEFISIASHQLRTPLTATKGYISMLLEGTYGSLAAKPEGVLKKVYASTERLSNIVEDLLNVSRMDQGRLVYNFVSTDLVHVIGEIVDELKITAEIKHIDLVFEKPKGETSFIIQADAEKLHQAIANLVDNAIKYTLEGSVHVMLKRIGSAPETIVVTVQDTGIGLTPEDKKKIFDRFSRGREGMRVNTKGSGLGLFIAKTIVEAHKGTLHAESAGRNKGSSFIIELPTNSAENIKN